MVLGVWRRIVVWRRWMRRRVLEALVFLTLMCVITLVSMSFELNGSRRRHELVEMELAKFNGMILHPANMKTTTPPRQLNRASVAAARVSLQPVTLEKSSPAGQLIKAAAATARVPNLRPVEERGYQCRITDEEHRLFPHCRNKIEWMREMWESDPCYKFHGVNGSDCSFLLYLSEIEGWCPPRGGLNSGLREEKTQKTNASITTNMQGLMELLKDPNPREAYSWIRSRIKRLWPKWVQAIHSLSAKQDLTKRTQKKILLHLGLLTKKDNWMFAENQFKGGPLGELVQWSDLISVLYILGHQLTITSEVEQLVPIMPKSNKPRSACQTREDHLLPHSIIYTDIKGLEQIKKLTGLRFTDLRCKFRIVDSFGTEPAFNNLAFAKRNNLQSPWGGKDLDPRQFFTMFPHSPDNSFMGFLVEHHLNDTGKGERKRGDIAVVYGKLEYMWKGKTDYLDVIKNYLDIHGTVAFKRNSSLPPYVINHGILPGSELHELLGKAKIFVGLGFPYEGPAPLEAIADGAVFLNPRFSPPHSRENNPFFRGKPTSREVTSQHSYAEVFIGKPHVYTIDMHNLTEVRHAVKEILQYNKFTAFTPYEFTEEGMLQRMSAYIQHQQFCNFQRTVPKWPPPSAVTFVMGQTGQSCAQACWAKDLRCEPSYFPDINSEEALKNKGVTCTRVSHSANIYYPAIHVDKQECILQDSHMLFSCVGSERNISRLCPCRNYIPQQSALCRGCER